MKNITALLILTFCLMGSLQLSAQLKKANFLFDQFKYSKAINLYKKAATDKDLKVRKEATVRLADCYRLMNNVSDARLWYSKAVVFKDVNPVNYYYLGMALRTLAQYEEAEKAFINYAQKVPSDPRGPIYAQFCRDIKQWQGLSPSAEIKNMQVLNSPYCDFGPVYYKDGLIITSDHDINLASENNYSWTSFGYLDLYHAEPSFYNNFWSDMTKPTKLSNDFNQLYHDGPACFSSDFKQIFITRTLKNSSKKDSANVRTELLKIFYATITEDKKVVYNAFPYNSDDYSVGHPTLSQDGKKLIFSSNKPGGFGQSDLYYSELVNGKWNEPVNLDSIVNTFGNEVFPFLANDSTLYFSSDGNMGFGGLDLFESNLVNGKWTTPWNLKLPLNSPYDDFSLVFHKNKSEGFFSSNRPGGLGYDDIYAFRNYQRTPESTKEPVPVIALNPAPKKQTLDSPMVSGYVKDKTTLAPIDTATVFLLNTLTNEVLVLKTNSDGYFEAPVTKGVLYITKAMKPDFFDDCLNFRFSNDEPGLKLKTPRDLLLGKYALNQVFVIENIYYDLDKWFIREDAKPPLDNLVRILKQYPINVELGSHTDARATFQYNIELSQKRAEAAVRYLTMNGINPMRMTAKGYGEMLLVNKCADGVYCSEPDHQANRRTEFKITSINSASSNKSAFNPNVFAAGDKIPVQLLEADFFNGCLDKSINNEEPNTTTAIPEPVKKEITQQVTKAPVKTVVKPTPAATAIPVSKIVEEEPTTEAMPISESSDLIWFSVQVYASTKPIKINQSNFKGETSIKEKRIGIYYKYFAGNYESIPQAAEQRKRLIAKFPGAFVVAFRGQDPITMDEARRLK